MHAVIQANDKRVAVSLMVEAQGWGRKGDRIVHRSGRCVTRPGDPQVVVDQIKAACHTLGISVEVVETPPSGIEVTGHTV